jgi:peptide deformylase
MHVQAILLVVMLPPVGFYNKRFSASSPDSRFHLLVEVFMALLPILHFPDPRLRTIAKPVESVTDEIRQLAADMLETMYAAPGIGLAASQVDQHISLIVMDLSEEKDQPYIFINTTVTVLTDELQPYDEGCLSVPDVFDQVERAARVRIDALDLNGKPFSIDADGLLAVCIQHEMDHLDGKLFVDYLSPLKRQRIRDKLSKRERQKVRAR